MVMQSKNVEKFAQLMARCPIVAILRGVHPDEVLEIGEALISNGIEIIEVPLNSPEPFESIRRLQARFGETALIGAGTVVTVEQVDRVRDAGGALVVSPNINPAVVRRTVETGLVSLPGVATPSEAYVALEAGAHAVKAFPADQIGCVALQAWKTILPAGTRLLAVGGVDEATLPRFRAAGITGFGVGGSLYKPGALPEQVGLVAKKLHNACLN
ncbi:2-dehydro-3-deoxy-6-phosphogalactonate aldolase [Ralstonia flaminis]|jgi:2-dehydro-3-deoxyphosphogalactonate aldolase|nr:2-dehydro-3-deoxy-6-phosphogalactonate aldolase [Ralstonia sp. LMG 18101]